MTEKQSLNKLADRVSPDPGRTLEEVKINKVSSAMMIRVDQTKEES